MSNTGLDFSRHAGCTVGSRKCLQDPQKTENKSREPRTDTVLLGPKGTMHGDTEGGGSAKQPYLSPKTTFKILTIQNNVVFICSCIYCEFITNTQLSHKEMIQYFPSWQESPFWPHSSTPQICGSPGSSHPCGSVLVASWPLLESSDHKL